MTTKASPFRHFCQSKNATSPIATQRWRQERSYVISTEEAAATERRNLLYKGVGSQIPPLAALGRDDKRGERLGRLTRGGGGPPRASAPTVDWQKWGERAAEGVGPYGRDDGRGGPPCEGTQCRPPAAIHDGFSRPFTNRQVQILPAGQFTHR